MVSQTKLVSSFPRSEFTNPCYRLFCKHRNQHRHKGQLIFYRNQDIPCKTINTFSFPNNLEILPLRIKLRSKKNTCYWVLQTYITSRWISFGPITPCFKVFIALHDFNISRDEGRLKLDSFNSFSLDDLIKTPTCYMATTPSSIDHIIANMTSLFMKSCNVEMGMSDHYKLIIVYLHKDFS